MPHPTRSLPVGGSRIRSFVMAVCLLFLLPLAGADSHSVSTSGRDTCRTPYVTPHVPGGTLVPCELYMGVEIIPGVCNAENMCSFTVHSFAIANASKPGSLWMATAVSTTPVSVCVGPSPVSQIVDEYSGHPCGRACTARNVGTTLTCAGSKESVIEIMPGKCASPWVYTHFAWGETIAFAAVEIPFWLCRQ